MADDDFNLESLAAYLHLTQAQVGKLAERGNLPGRKVGGQWRFSQAEIHGWLEDRIGLSDDEELAQMETVLQPSAALGEEPISIADLLPLDAIAVPLAARTRGSVISELIDQAAKTGWLWDTQKMIEAVRARESLHSTALENGVALLHPRRPLPSILGQAFLALGCTSRGLPFGGSTPTDVFFLICSLEDRGHLRVIARLSRLVGDPEFLLALRAAPDARSARQAIIEAETRRND